MANPLLDFVMSVVRDPDVAAHYAADPAGAIAEAHLTGVTTADVAHLIPVVSESMASVPPMSSTAGDVPVGGGDHSAVNVWTSGAATAAFDAFDSIGAHVSTRVSDTALGQFPDTGIHQVISDPGTLGADSGTNATGLPVHTSLPDLTTAEDPALHPDVQVVDSGHLDSAGPLDWHHPVDTADPSAGTGPDQHQGFDFFN